MHVGVKRRQIDMPAVSRGAAGAVIRFEERTHNRFAKTKIVVCAASTSRLFALLVWRAP